MKKILIGAIIALLIGFNCLILIKGVKVGSIKLESVRDIQAKSKNLDDTLTNANDLTKKTYPSQIEALNSAIKNLNLAKEQYQNKTANMTDTTELGMVQVKTYKVEFLWTIIGNYATKEGAILTLDIKNTQNKDTYDLAFNLTGSYIAITTFIEDIENDENLKFEIENLEISSGITNTTETNNKTNNTNSNNTTNNTSNKTNTNTNSTVSTQKNDGKILQATFTVKGVTIELN